MAYLLNSVKEYLDPEFIAEVAQSLRVDDAQAAAGLDAWSAAILAGLLNHVDNPKAMNRIFSGLDQFPPDLAQHPAALLRTGNLAKNDPKDISGHLLGQLFGPKITALNTSIAEASGAPAAAVSEMLGIAGPMVLSVLGRRLQAGELSVSGLANLLRAEQPRIAAVLSPDLATIIGSSTLEAPDAEPVEPVEGTRWGLALLLVVALALAVLIATKQC